MARSGGDLCEPSGSEKERLLQSGKLDYWTFRRTDEADTEKSQSVRDWRRKGIHSQRGDRKYRRNYMGNNTERDTVSSKPSVMGLAWGPSR